MKLLSDLYITMRRGLMGHILLLFPVLAIGSPLGVYFEHKDWLLVCDNTRTCRSAGYQSNEGTENPVSVLLVRRAGPDQPVSGQVTFDEVDESLPPRQLVMQVDGKNVGYVKLNKEFIGQLTTTQTNALLAAVMARDGKVEWSAGKQRWSLSSNGANAVLLKMDEFQGRVGTVGALIRKGKRHESTVLPALPMPTVNAATVTRTLPADIGGLVKSANLIKTLRSTVAYDAEGNSNCPDLLDKKTAEVLQDLTVVRLNADKLLVSVGCWGAAYNSGTGYWVINNPNKEAAIQPQLVTTDASDYDRGKIVGTQKARGIGDCWSGEAWVWDGQHFVQTDEYSTGLCRGFAGGAWTLPLFVTDVHAVSR